MNSLLFWASGLTEGFVLGCWACVLAGFRRRPRPAEANPKQSAEQNASKLLTSERTTR